MKLVVVNNGEVDKESRLQAVRSVDDNVRRALQAVVRVAVVDAGVALDDAMEVESALSPVLVRPVMEWYLL